MANKSMIAEELQRGCQIALRNMELDDSTAKEVSCLYEPWEVLKDYPVGRIVRYDEDENGEPILYRVIKAHVSREDLTPDKATSYFKIIE